MNDIDSRRLMWPDTTENIPREGINPNRAVRELGESWTDVSVFVTDVGQHQMWSAQSVQLSREQRFLTSGGMGSMGFGLPALVGAALARPSDPVCLIAGDGGFQCNIQELQTVSRLHLPVRIVVLDNGCYGMVRQFQESYFDSRFYSTRWGYSAPDFRDVAHAYGITARRVGNHTDWKAALKEVADLPREPALIHVDIEGDLNAYPKMSFGQPYGSMEPLVSPLDMEGT
ncbi:MAG: thiamine pyrophosphate-dependent enzyme [Actinomycetes bacterium]